MNKTPGAIIQARKLFKQVTSPTGQLTILQNINLSIKQGQSVSIVGVSGSGKSTLIGLLAGLDTPTSGTVILDETDLGKLDEDGRARLRNERVGFVFQSFQLLPSMTALENVMLPLELVGNNNCESVAIEKLQDVGLGERLHHYPRQLSGGEQQRVAIARAFAGNPRILFADEPTGNLDQVTARQIINLLFRINEEHGTTLILVTHDPEIASRCDFQLTLAGGRIISDSST